MQQFTALPDDDGLIYGQPYNPSNPTHQATMDMRETMRQIYMERDAAIAKICLKYDVTLEEAAKIYTYQFKTNSPHRNNSFGMRTLEHFLPRKPQALVDWEEKERLASMNHNFRPRSGGFQPKNKPDPWDRN